MNEYIIVGDTEQFVGCLICTCGALKETAEKVLKQMLTHPTERDKELLLIHHNIRIEEVYSKDCWWNDSFLAN